MRSALAAVLLLLASCARAASPRPAAATTPLDMPRDLVRAARLEVSPEGLLTLAATGGLFALARPDDQRVKRAVLVNPPPVSKSLADAGTTAGNGVLYAAAAASYGAGWALKSPRAREFGAMSLEALALAGVQTEVLKVSARRRRPDGADLNSFPSGHASESFAAATVAACDFGWKAGVPASLAAGFVGYSRLQNNKHWLSDVVFGAGLGVLSGRAVWRAHQGKERRVVLAPYFDGARRGVLVSARF